MSQWLDTTTTFGWLADGEWSGHTAKILAATLVWMVLPLAGGIVRTLRREVKWGVSAAPTGNVRRAF